ncbi:DUF1851 domain-containing protein [Chryseobacterium ginsengisoli]|uniref:DUF1851 domain-containing protein n=1 Tax=Chryseobacterium ginsengisoli TaxID=363853 RepID=A0ABP9M4R9_9FLAO
MIKNLIQEYRDKLPQKLLDCWNLNGFTTLSNDFIKVVNPNDYKDILNQSYESIGKPAYVIFATGLGDLIIWENNYIILLNFRRGKSKVIESGFNFFLEDIKDDSFLLEELDSKNFKQGAESLGQLSFDECFSYEPLLGLGGAEKVENLKKVKIKEYISITAQALGKIG